MEYQYQLKAIQTLNVEKGGSYRGDCLFCLNRNTLSVRNENGNLVWNCFHSSCEAKGMSNNGVTVDDLETFMESKALVAPSGPTEFNIPKEFVTIYGNNKARQYVDKYELQNTDARLMYDVKQNRIVFLIEDYGKIVGAVGRGLADDIIPKWYKYNTCHLPFVVGTNKYIGIVVEDCVSACKVAMANLTGIAIMGTSLKQEFISPIASIVDRCFVCLDKDATEKSFKIKDALSYHVPTYVEMIDKDLKNYNVEELKKWSVDICKTLKP